MSSMRMTAIQTKAVRKSRRRIMVRGSTRACMEGDFFKKILWETTRCNFFIILHTCTPPSKSSSSRAQTSDPGKPRSGSSWYWDRKRSRQNEFRIPIRVCTHFYILAGKHFFRAFLISLGRTESSLEYIGRGWLVRNVFPWWDGMTKQGYFFPEAPFPTFPTYRQKINCNIFSCFSPASPCWSPWSRARPGSRGWPSPGRWTYGNSNLGKYFFKKFLWDIQVCIFNFLPGLYRLRQELVDPVCGLERPRLARLALAAELEALGHLGLERKGLFEFKYLNLGGYK